MPRAEKRYGEIIEGKLRGWRFEELRSILEWAGFEMSKGTKGSHRTFRHAASGTRVTIPNKGSGWVKPVYVEKLKEALEKAKEAE